MVSSLKIESKDFGKIEVTEEQRVIFPRGLYGFEKYKEYYIIDYDQIFKCLQSKDEKEIAFIIINPYRFKRDYVLDIEEDDYKEIGFGEDEEEIKECLDLYVVVTIPSVDPNNMTANLLGPLIVNSKTKIGRQSLSRNPDYDVKHNILEELAKDPDDDEEID